MEQILKDVFAVEVPDKSSLFELNNGCELFLLPHSGHSVRKKWAILPPGSYEILFTTLSCTEEQAAGVVEYDPLGEGWEHYMSNEEAARHDRIDLLSTAIISLQSLLRSKNLDPAKNYLLIRKL